MVLWVSIQRNRFGRENTLILLFWQQYLIYHLEHFYKENSCSTFFIIMLPKAWKQCLIEMAVSQQWHMHHTPLSLAGIVYPTSWCNQSLWWPRPGNVTRDMFAHHKVIFVIPQFSMVSFLFFCTMDIIYYSHFVFAWPSVFCIVFF